MNNFINFEMIAKLKYFSRNQKLIFHYFKTNDDV